MQRNPDRPDAGGDHDPASDDALFEGEARETTGLISSQWWQMSIVLGLIVVALAVSAWSLPGLVAGLMAMIAIPLPALARLRSDLGRRLCRTTHGKVAIIGTVIALPLFLFGAAVALWARSGRLPWEEAVFGLALIVLIATVIASRRLVSTIVAQVALWSGAVCVTSRFGGIATLLLGVGIAVLAYARQAAIETRMCEKEERNQRIRDRAQEILADYEQSGQGWFWETDRRGTITYLSTPVAAIVGADVEQLMGRPFAELFDLSAHSGDGERTLAFHLSARSAFSELAVRAATPDGHERWWSITGRPTYDAFSNFQGFRGSGADLTEMRKSQEKVSRLAQYDSLTGLSNRFQISQTLEKILAAPHIHQRACSVLLLDLDRFKQVNDTLGHPAGDALLKQVSQRLERVVGKSGRVGRLGGDEFQVVVPGKIDREVLAQLAAQIIDALSQPYSIEGSRVTIGASVGIALAPDDGVTSEALIRNADLALYAAKDGGRGRHHFYAADLHSDAEQRRKLEDDLRDAVANGGLELHYQPVVQTATENVTGFEALLRWKHPEQGWITPDVFIPIAEDTGLIAAIGEWALRTACADLAKWPANVRVAVNVSPLQFANPALPAIVTNALAWAEVAANRLELEITESVFLNDDEDTDTMFRALKAIGVRLALDDFGTGYSSLGYLKKAPFDKIKIDQGFVRGATQPGSRNGAIISSIVSLADALGMETTAEGVETLDELDLVRMLGVSHVQGYIYERPLNAESAAARLETGLQAIARGPRSARATRQTMLRKVELEHAGHRYHGTIRNISVTGALIEGLWNVPPGTIFRIQLSEGHVVTATSRWSTDDRLGVEFATPLRLDDNGRIAAVAGRPVRAAEEIRVAPRKVG